MNNFVRRLSLPVILLATASLFFLLFLAVVDPDHWLIRDTESVAPWASALAAIVLAALTAGYVAATEDMAKSTRQLAEETRVARELSTTPTMVVYFEFVRSWLLHIAVENIGHGLAHKVRVDFAPPIPGRRGPIPALPLNAQSIPVLRPQEKFAHFVHAPVPFFAEGSAHPKLYKATVYYEDSKGRQMGPIEFPLDLTIYEGMRVSDEKDLTDIAKSLEEMSRTFKSVTDLHAIRVKTPSDIRRETREFHENWEAERAAEQASAVSNGGNPSQSRSKEKQKPKRRTRRRHSNP